MQVYYDGSYMKLLFASLLCHRDVPYFLLNWFTMRAYLDRGFEIPHLILNDGSLTDDDFQKLEALPNIYLEKEKVHLYETVPKPVYLAKLECFRVGFEKYNADRVVIMDCDIFFFRNWEADLRKICASPSIVFRDWGSSLGPFRQEYKDYFGIHEDTITPNCNTGFNSIPREQYYKIRPVMDKHLAKPFLILEDQGITFAAYYGQLEFVNNIQCCINGGETVPEILNWWLSQNACHLMGMRERPAARKLFIEHSLAGLPPNLHLKQFPPEQKHITFGLMEYDVYSFKSELHKIPSTYNGKYINDALYLHGGSRVHWKLPPRCQIFEARLICLDTGIKENCKPVMINDQVYPIETDLKINLNGSLDISLPDGPGTHYAFLSPHIIINKEWINA